MRTVLQMVIRGAIAFFRLLAIVLAVALTHRAYRQHEKPLGTAPRGSGIVQ